MAESIHIQIAGTTRLKRGEWYHVETNVRELDDGSREFEATTLTQLELDRKFVIEVTLPYKELRHEWEGLVAEGYAHSFETYVAEQPRTALEYAEGWWSHATFEIKEGSDE